MTNTAKALLNDVRVALNSYTAARMRGDGNAERLKQKTLQAQSVLKEFVREIFANYYNPWNGTLSKSETWILAEGLKWTPRHVMLFRAVEKAIEENLKNEPVQAGNHSTKPNSKGQGLSEYDSLSEADMKDEDWEFVGAEELAEEVWHRVLRAEAGEFKTKKA